VIDRTRVVIKYFIQTSLRKSSDLRRGYYIGCLMGDKQ
jgi:hypothetical protein